jgi:hypothetical protein
MGGAARLHGGLAVVGMSGRTGSGGGEWGWSEPCGCFFFLMRCRVGLLLGGGKREKWLTGRTNGVKYIYGGKFSIEQINGWMKVHSYHPW